MNDGEDAPHWRKGSEAHVLAAIVIVAAVALVNAPIAAATYPERPIRLIVPSAPGGPTDIPARLLSQILPNLSGELFKSAAGVDIVGVPYKSGGDSITGVLGGQVDMTFESITVLLPLIREGRLRALAATSRHSTPLADDLPTMIEAGVPGYEVTTFNGLVAPAGTPEPIIGLLNAVINEGLRTREIQASIRNLGAVSDPVSPAQFGAFIAAERRKWSMVAKEASVHID